MHSVAGKPFKYEPDYNLCFTGLHLYPSAYVAAWAAGTIDTPPEQLRGRVKVSSFMDVGNLHPPYMCLFHCIHVSYVCCECD